MLSVPRRSHFCLPQVSCICWHKPSVLASVVETEMKPILPSQNSEAHVGRPHLPVHKEISAKIVMKKAPKNKTKQPAKNVPEKYNCIERFGGLM